MYTGSVRTITADRLTVHSTAILRGQSGVGIGDGSYVSIHSLNTKYEEDYEKNEHKFIKL